MAATARQCAITLFPNNVEIWCLHTDFSPSGNQFRAVITSIINISQSYGGGGGGQMLRQENDTS